MNCIKKPQLQRLKNVRACAFLPFKVGSNANFVIYLFVEALNASISCIVHQAVTFQNDIMQLMLHTMITRTTFNFQTFNIARALIVLHFKLVCFHGN